MFVLRYAIESPLDFLQGGSHHFQLSIINYFFYLGGAGDYVLSVVVEVEADPACAAAFLGGEEVLGFVDEAEGVAGLEVVEGEVLRGGVVGVVVQEEGVDLVVEGAVEGDALDVVCDEGGYVVGEAVEVGDEEFSVFVLPFVAVGLDGCLVQEVAVEVCHFVEEHHEELVWVHVPVYANLVKVVARLRPAVVAQLGGSFSCDVEPHTVAVHEVEYRIYCSGWDILVQGLLVLVYLGLSHWK